MKIGIDIDGTITDNFNLIKELACEYFKKDEKEINSWDWDFGKVFNVSKLEAQKFWDINEKKIYTLPGPKPFAQQTIAAIAEKHEIIYVTARSITYREDTEKWLQHHNIHFNRLIMAEDKMQICVDEKISIMIDDSPEYISIADYINLIMFDYPYNRHVNHPKISRVTNWNEIIPLINACCITKNSQL
jgi:uncharacterized HAD superfamily protein